VITTLDRMALLSFFRSYAIVWTSLVSLYVVIDLFTHLDAYVNRPGGFPAVARHIIMYYGYRLPQVFDLMAEPIALLAATFTVSWMQKNNEMLPQLSAGIPTRRIIRPVLIGAAVTIAFAPLNTEFLIPAVADELMTSRDDPEGSKAQILMGAYDTSGVHLEGMAGFRKGLRIENFCATFPENSPSGFLHLKAEEAIYVPPGDGPLSGGWMLVNTTPDMFAGSPPTNLTVLGTGRAFLKVDTADFDSVSRGGTWYVFAPTSRLREMLTGAEPRRQVKMAVLFHTRSHRFRPNPPPGSGKTHTCPE
jgi:lipopolysaccharide export system permease protein